MERHVRLLSPIQCNSRMKRPPLTSMVSPFTKSFSIKNFTAFAMCTDNQVPALIESEISSKEFRKNWARLIQKIYPPRWINPLLCPKCLGSMRIISFIEDEEVISKILKHLGLWEVKQRPPPRANAPFLNIHIDYTARPGATTSYVRIRSVPSCKTGFRV